MPGDDDRHTDVSQGAVSERPGNGRRTKKAKTGCITCKIRRVKCDETKPHCLRCTKLGRVCDGYSQPKRKVKHSREASTGVIAIQPRASMLSLYNPTIVVDGSSDERRYFHLFSQTTTHLCGYFDSLFWLQIVPQTCLYEPSIRHAATAIAALVKALEMSPPPPMGGAATIAPRDSHYAFAIRQYNRAIAALRQTLISSAATTSPSQPNPKLRTALIACVLFVCIEAIQGDQRAASDQIHGGLNLMQAVHRTCFQNDTSSSNTVTVVEDDILQIYAAINLQSYFLAFSQSPGHPSSDEILPRLHDSRRHVFSASIPRYFTSVLEAKRALDLILSAIAQFHNDFATSQPQNGHEQAPEPRGGIGAKADRYAQHHARLHHWEAAFVPLATAGKQIDPMADPEAYMAPLVVSVYHHLALILLGASVRADETVFDGLRKHFASIIASCQEVMVTLMGNYVIGGSIDHPNRSRSSDGGIASSSNGALDPLISASTSTSASTGTTPRQQRHRPSFSFDVGILPPLFVVATKCRDPILRRQAIALLEKCPVQEGLWHPIGAAKAGEWIMGIEELGLSFGAGGDGGARDGGDWRGTGNGNNASGWHIPEEHRVRLCGMRCELTRSQMWVQCRSVFSEPDGDADVGVGASSSTGAGVGAGIGMRAHSHSHSHSHSSTHSHNHGEAANASRLPGRVWETVVRW